MRTRLRSTLCAVLALGVIGFVWWLATRDHSIVFRGPPPLDQWVGGTEGLADWRDADGAVTMTNGSSWIGTEAHLPDRCIVSLTVSQTPHLGDVFVSVFTSDPNPRVVYSPDYRMTSHYTICFNWSGVTLKKIDPRGREVWLSTEPTEYFRDRNLSRLQIFCDRARGYFALTADGNRLAEWRDTDTPAGEGTGFSLQAFGGGSVFSVRELVVERWRGEAETTHD